MFLAFYHVLLPDCSSEERIKCIQPVMHLFVIGSLKQYSTVFRTHSKCIWGLSTEPKKKAYYTVPELFISEDMGFWNIC